MGLAVMLAGCGSNAAEVKEYAKKRGMSESQTAAFEACASGHRRSSPLFPADGGTMKMKSVPLEVCDCQSRVMVAIFAEKEYSGYGSFADYMGKDVKKRHLPRFRTKALQSNIKSPDAAKRLEASFKSCVGDYEAKNKETADQLFEFLPDEPGTGKDNGKTASAS
jgi:hypothetical protein